MNRLPWLLALAGTLSLSGCFGGSDEVAAPPAAAERTVPDAAYASSSAFTQFSATEAQTSSDTLGPLALGDKAAPVSDTDAPVPVN